MGKRARRAGKIASEPAEVPAARAVSQEDRRPEWVLYALLVIAIFAVYWQVHRFDYVNFDDPDYISGNNHVRAGLTWAGVQWALTSTAAANWFPLTWLSNMAVYQLCGLDPGWHHLVNVVIHALASVLLLASLRRMTGAFWPSAFVAFVFALHPLHVESVAWVSERKDVLCALFWCLALWCYALYVERPSPARYAAVVAAFAGGLMSKSMIVTLPFVLLLLDFWPLRRTWTRSLVWEKVPMLALAGAVSVLTLASQEAGHAVRSLATLPLGERVANALWTYVVYIGRLIWPANLAVYYPYSHHRSAGQLLLAGAVVVGVTALAVRWRRERPYVAVGWFWYLGTLVPVIGLVQVGGQSSADRYTYLPTIGLTIALAWALDFEKTYTKAAAGAIIAVCAVLAVVQTSYWENSGLLFRHAADVTTGNYIADNNLADYYLTQMRTEDARAPVMEALRLNPDYPEAHVNLATILRRTGQMAESEREYRAAIQLQSRSAAAHAGYGALLLQENRAADAAAEFARVVELQPEDAEGRYNLGRVLVAIGRFDQGVAQLREAIRLRPDYSDPHRSLALAFAGRGRIPEAVAEFEAEAGLLVAEGKVDEAIAEYATALRLEPNSATARRGLDDARARGASRR